LAAAGVALTLTLALGVGVVHAACGTGNLDDFCSATFGATGGPSTVGIPIPNSAPTTANVDQANLLPAGPLLYVDFKTLETEARTLLDRSMKFRQDISPYRGDNNFNDVVRHFDENSGFSATYTDKQLGQLSLQQRIDIADADLLRARDLYGVLAVYAPDARFRLDDGTNQGSPGANYKNGLCAQPENPAPPDPTHSGQVLDPIMDWCNFPARLRQAVREAAYLRMIFAQQFMVDALGLHFSAGSLLGGETFVRQEVAKLQAAQYQYQLAEQELTSALGVRLGSGCYVADFYTQAEWSLLSRAAEGELSARQEIGTRLSYLDINTVDDVPRAQKSAFDQYRAGSTEAYVKMIGLAGQAVLNNDQGAGCGAKGARPDGALVSEMTLTMLDTRRAATEVRAGRNIFGFDIRFTPARPYHTAFGSTDKGLWEQAADAANLALQIQQQTENAERAFDLNQQELTKAILATNNQVDNDIQKEAGCDLQGFANDQEWYACIDAMIQHTQECDPQNDATFDACMQRTTDGQPARADGSNLLILVSDMRTARQDLRTAWLGVEAAIRKRDNIVQRANTEAIRNIKVKNAINTNATESSVIEAISAAAQFVDVTSAGEVTFHPGAVVEAGLRPAEILRQAAHDIEIEDANSEAVVRNLFYDMAEAQGEIDIAAQQYQSLLTQFNGVVGQTGHDVYQSKREHAYTTSLPANDPSYRLVRDSRRLALATQLEIAARLAYLAARRAEYEYTARLSASNFRISDIYRARTADDILKFLQNLDNAVTNLPGGVRDAETNQTDLTISVAQHILGLTDQYLKGQGVVDADLQTERDKRFRQWLSQNTYLGSDGKPTLLFSFTTSSAINGIISRVVTQDYGFFWLHKVGGIGQPKATSDGFGVNLVTDQPGSLGYRLVRVTQSGEVGLTSFAGCLFDYRLIPPAALMGLEFPLGQPTDQVTGVFNGDINGVHGNPTPGYSTPAFLGRPLASNGWQVVINAGSPNGILPDLDMQQLTDIELKVSTTYASRSSNTLPSASQCVRADY
jgi:hypothetical protein